METGKLMCERCEEKIPIDIFIPHIQQCVGRPRFLKSNPEPSASNLTSGSPQSGNKDGKSGSKSETNSDGGSSILGSLEQLVKGNFTASASAASTSSGSKLLPPISSSPITTFPPPQSSPLGNRFSIDNLFPVTATRGSSSPPSSPGSGSEHLNSKPGSPIVKPGSPNSTNNNVPPGSLEKMLDSPLHQGPKSPFNGVDEDRKSTTSPMGSEKSRSSPGLGDEEKEEKNDDEKDSKKPSEAGHALVQDRPCLIQEQSLPSLGPSIRPPMPVEMEIQPSNAHFVTHPLSAKAPTDIILAKCILPKRIWET